MWISPDPRSHIQATGRDARGRKQYRYHPAWREFRDRVKFDHLVEFGTVLPVVRRRVERDLAVREITRDRVVATIVRLLELSLVRVGNEEYARANGSYGLTTLRRMHARVEGHRLELSFRGKSGKDHRTQVEDRRVARAVPQLQELPGQVLFRYVGPDGELCPVGSSDVNDYLREVSGADITAKEYRTWMGSVLAASALAELPAPTSPTDARRSLMEVLRVVSADLGNTPAVCRASYVHPAVIAAFEEGSLGERWQAASGRGSRTLTADERRFLSFLRSSRRRRGKPAAAESAGAVAPASARAAA